MKNQRKGVGKMILKRAKKFLDLILFRSKEREIEEILVRDAYRDEYSKRNRRKEKKEKKRRNRLFIYDGKYGRYSEDRKENDFLTGANLETQGENTTEMLLFLGRQLKVINGILDNLNPNVVSFYSDEERSNLKELRKVIADMRINKK